MAAPNQWELLKREEARIDFHRWNQRFPTEEEISILVCPEGFIGYTNKPKEVADAEIAERYLKKRPAEEKKVEDLEEPFDYSKRDFDHLGDCLVSMDDPNEEKSSSSASGSRPPVQDPQMVRPRNGLDGFAFGRAVFVPTVL